MIKTLLKEEENESGRKKYERRSKKQKTNAASKGKRNGDRIARRIREKK